MPDTSEKLAQIFGAQSRGSYPPDKSKFLFVETNERQHFRARPARVADLEVETEAGNAKRPFDASMPLKEKQAWALWVCGLITAAEKAMRLKAGPSSSCSGMDTLSRET